MRILWVKVGGLWPLNTGGRLRSFHILAELSKRHSVILVTTHRLGEDAGALAGQLPHCEGLVSLPHAAPKQGSACFVTALLRSWFSPLPVDLWKWRVPAVRRCVEGLLRDPGVDLCVADFLTALPNLPRNALVPVVHFSHNVEHMIWKRLSQVEGRPWRRALLEIEWRKMRRCETRACTRAARTIAVSPADRDFLAANSPGADVRAIPTGVDTSFFTPQETAEAPDHLVFTGSMDWHPNEDGILHFMDAILPLIRREVPGVSLAVVGRNPGPPLKEAGVRAGVQVTGTVEDIRPHVARAAVYIVPLRVGGGTRLKIFEALAMGKAVVSTSVGAEGLPLDHGRHFLRADEPEAFASAVISLLRGPDRRRELGAAGRRLVEERYGWRRVAREFGERCEEVKRRHQAEPDSLVACAAWERPPG